jgi:alpha-mannosidase
MKPIAARRTGHARAAKRSGPSMNDMLSHLLTLKAETRGYWAERILAELEFAVRLSRGAGRQHDALIRTAIESLAAQQASMGGITRDVVEETEAKIQALAEEAKGYTLLCAAHAHIDMNWLWRFDETVAVTLDTFRTMLTLMTEYPGFIFSQSQAAVYRIVEEHDPEMLKEIRKRVKEGRWEVTASTWVEADKNMPSGESLARHALYAKRALARLLDIAPETLLLDFEPDTFGHSRNVPEILSGAGVRWYYHCRGYDGHILYKWQAPSGAQVITYRDPWWYNGEVGPSFAATVPDFCRKNGMPAMLRVYGVGDHGGGPTRRDIERIIDMDSWPVFPRIRFATFREFFQLAENVSDKLPVVNRELNPVFTGCYTTQARIKSANRTVENRLVEAETFSSIASVVTSSQYRTAHLARAWEAALFNQFHDIIPGAGVVDTREYALGRFQQIMAVAGTEESLALRRIASLVDTSALGDPKEDARATTSEGGGAAYGVFDFTVSLVERGRGRTRIVHVFNSLPWARTGHVEAVIWDWPGDPARLQVRDAAGAEIAHQILPNEERLIVGKSYWGHQYLRLLLPVSTPGCGYATLSLTETPPHELLTNLPDEPRVERLEEHVLENDLIRAVFDPRTAELASLVDKASGEEMIDRARGGGMFRLVNEDDAKGMTAWIVGRWKSVRSVHDDVRLSSVAGGTGLRQWLSFEAGFAASRLKVTVSLDKGSASLSWSVECEWLEIGRKGSGIPQLNFFLPLTGEMKAYRYDVPFGVVDRHAALQDFPANSWALGVPKKPGRAAVMLIADQKHGFRCVENSLSLTLLRSSFDPDPHPDLGVHRFGFAVALVDCASAARLAAAASERAHPLVALSGTAHAGSLPLTQGFFSLEGGSVAVSTIKMPEDEEGARLLVRLYETDGKKTTAGLKFFCAPDSARRVDINESTIGEAGAVSLEGDVVRVELEPYTVQSIVVHFEGCRQ